MTTMTLHEKVRVIIMTDDTGEGPVSTAGNQPGAHDFHATDCEAAMRAWGCIYGIAFGLGRSEEPCESIESVAERAYEAAWPVFLEFNGRIDIRAGAREVYDPTRKKLVA